MMSLRCPGQLEPITSFGPSDQSDVALLCVALEMKRHEVSTSGVFILLLSGVWHGRNVLVLFVYWFVQERGFCRL